MIFSETIVIVSRVVASGLVISSLLLVSGGNAKSDELNDLAFWRKSVEKCRWSVATERLKRVDDRIAELGKSKFKYKTDFDIFLSRTQFRVASVSASECLKEVNKAEVDNIFKFYGF
jgi:hypothetical protein